MSKTTNRVRKHLDPIGGGPSRNDIESLCRQIRAKWTDTQKQKRSGGTRVDGADRQFRAHLRFVEFLIEQSRTK